MRPLPLCPYCETPLLPLARDTWLVEMAGGPWILGRDRMWGVPLPVWDCETCGEQVCVAGLDDLAHRTGLEVGQIEPHRPSVDRLTFPCETCGGTMRRVPAVVDAAFEAALLPWATASRPGPADLAVGLGDRHLGWLGDLTEVASLLWGALAWQQAVTAAEGGSGLSWDVERVPSADVLRWAAHAGTTPTQAEGSFLRPLWRSVVIPLTGLPSSERGGLGESDDGELLDRWLMARFYRGANAVTAALDSCDPQRGAEELAALVDDLAGWYVPHRSGGRVEVLGMLGRLLAPFVPHVAEAIHRRIGERAVESVHLADWPLPDPAWADQALLDQMALVRRLAALGQTARRRAGIDPDRLLPRALVGFQPGKLADYTVLVQFQDLLARVMGVARVEFGPEGASRVSWRLGLNPDQTVERDVATEEIEAALSSLDPDAVADLASHLGAGLSVSFEATGQAITLLPDEITISVRARPGWAAETGAGHLVVLEVG